MSEKLSIIATGRRKTAVAQVQLIKGSGQLTINGKDDVTYFQGSVSSIHCVKAPLKFLNSEQKELFSMICVKSPLEVLNLEKDYDLIVKVKGGGFVGQAEAIQLGISRALCDLKDTYRGILKYRGFLRRDSRSKERKKYGLKKARKAPQYSKR